MTTFQRAFLWAPLVFACLVMGWWYGAYWYFRAQWLRQDPRPWRNQSRLTTQPLQIFTGMAIGRNALIGHLRRAGYSPQADGAALAKGAYRLVTDRLEVMPRSTDFTEIAIEWRGESILAIQNRAGAPLRHARLEPEILLQTAGVPNTQFRRDVVTPEEISGTNLAYALQVREDRQFRSHKGIQPGRMVRGAFNGQGGSTITQQTAKNLIGDFSRKFPRMVARKLIELPMTAALEDAFSKDEILAFYANLASFGRGPDGQDMVGVKQASSALFGKSSGDLRAEEAVTMAWLLPAPYPRSRELLNGDPTGRIKLMRDTSLRTMQELWPARFGKSDIDAASMRPIQVRKGSERLDADRCTGYIVSLLLQTQAGEQRGWQGTTTIDPVLQRQACELVTQSVGKLRERAPVDAALFAVDSTGAVLAMAGGADRLQSLRNHASAYREVASIVKPFALLPVLDPAAHSLNTVLGATPDLRLKDCTLPPMSLKVAFAKSVNCHLEALITAKGSDRSFRFVQQIFRLDTPPPAPLVYGKFAAQPRQVARAYSLFHNEDRIAEERWFEGPPAYTRVAVNPGALRQVQSLMRSVVERGGTAEHIVEQAYLPSSMQVLAKTGTGSLNDLWCVLLAGRLTIVVWVGADDRTPLAASERWTGGLVAGPIAASFLKRVYRYRPELLASPAIARR